MTVDRKRYEAEGGVVEEVIVEGETHTRARTHWLHIVQHVMRTTNYCSCHGLFICRWSFYSRGIRPNHERRKLLICVHTHIRAPHTHTHTHKRTYIYIYIYTFAHEESCGHNIMCEGDLGEGFTSLTGCGTDMEVIIIDDDDDDSLSCNVFLYVFYKNREKYSCQFFFYEKPPAFAFHETV